LSIDVFDIAAPKFPETNCTNQKDKVSRCAYNLLARIRSIIENHKMHTETVSIFRLPLLFYQILLPLHSFRKNNMDIQSLKLDLVKRILNTEKPSVLIKISKLFQTESTQDWWDQLPVEVQESILEGLKDAEQGDVFTHDQVMNEAREKYGF
jgi:predicted transcriptional regulator